MSSRGSSRPMRYGSGSCIGTLGQLMRVGIVWLYMHIGRRGSSEVRAVSTQDADLWSIVRTLEQIRPGVQPWLKLC